MTSRYTTAFALVALTLAAAPAPPPKVPLYKNLGTFSRSVGTKSSMSQKYFDQGMRLMYAFNHAEAIRSFREAYRLSNDCLMCIWGIAYAYGPNINAPMDSAAGVKAYEAAEAAVAKARYVALPVELALINALRTRYAQVPPANRGRLDSAYAFAMKDVAHQFPDDDDVATLLADAMMNLRPWNYWDRETGHPQPGTVTIVDQLEKVINRNPKHPGACHLYIHAVEAMEPEKAVPCAERLASLMPGAGHLVHMPAHIYIRVGRYADAVEANVHAVHQDQEFIEGQKPEGLYPIAYYPHNHHFLSLAATMAGRSAQAIDAANKTAATTPVELAQQIPQLEPFLHYPFLTLVTFGRWDDVLARPLPPTILSFSYGMAQYARGVAFAGKGDFAAARAALDTVKQVRAAGTQGTAWAGWTTPATNLEIAEHALAGEIAAREGQLDAAITHFKAAQDIEDAQLYTEPPDWYYPIRHSLGAVLLKAGKPADAEKLYRQDLKRFAENGWALFGLAQSLHAQEKHEEAAKMDARFAKAWSTADVKLTASRF